MADKKVTSEEYERSFREFKSCMDGIGNPVVDGPKVNESYEYSFPASKIAESDECYRFTFEQVDIAWQVQHEDTSSTTLKYKECLRVRGVEPAKTTLEVDAQLRAAGIEPADCLDGKIRPTTAPDGDA